MPLVATFTGLSARADGFTDGNPNYIYDNFARTTAGSLGAAASGQTWNAITGVWNANGSAANTASTPSTYPMATINFKTQCTITCQSVTPGGGIAFWEQNSTNWLAAVIAITNSYNQGPATCVSNSCCTGSNTCASNSCCTGSPTGGCNANACCTGSNTCVYNPSCPSNPATCTWNSWTNQSSSVCIANGGVYGAGSDCGGSGTCKYAQSSPNYACCGGLPNSCCTGSNTCAYNSCCTTYSTCSGSSCCTGSNTCVSNSCCSYAYYSPVYSTIATVSILQNVAGTVSVMASGTYTTTSGSGYPPPNVQSLKVALVGTAISVTGYSDTSLASSVVTVSATAASSPIYTGTGIVMSASTANQGTTVGAFSAN
jgi:hypothetical protein